MTPDQRDDLALLAAANPVHAREPLDDAERTWANALLERIVDEPADEPSRLDERRLRGARRLTLAGAAALALTVVAAVLVFPGGPGGKGADAVAQAVAALSGREGIFHVVTQTTTVTTAKPGAAPTRRWTETWASAGGGRSRSLIFGVTPEGGRGRLLAERVGDTMVSSRNKPRDGGGISFGDGEAVRPRPYLLELLRSGRVTRRAAVTSAGRPAWQFEIETRIDNSFVEEYGRHTAVPAYTRRTVLVVDRRTHLPLSVRTSGVVATSVGPRSRVTFPRETTISRFSRFERLTDSAGAAGLRPSRRFRHR